MKKLKIAIVHDYIKEYGGAERVVEALHEIYPDAPIYTSVYLPHYLGPHRSRVEKWDIRPLKLISWIPFRGKLLSPLRLFSPFLFRMIDLSEYDVVIVSAAGTYTSPNYVRKGENTLHICYCHTPPRYLYGYATAADWSSVWWRKGLKALGVIPMHILRLLDFKAGQLPDILIANSEEVKKRIEKFYRRDSIVINPPVDLQTAKSQKLKANRDYYLTGGRLARAKHNDIPILACTTLGLPLKVFGKTFAGYEEELKKIAGPTIEFVGEVDDEQKQSLMTGAKAFLYASEDEDFGIIPVESMAAGTPVIAHRSGGVVETVVENETGIFYDNLTEESMIKAIKQFEKMTFSSEISQKRAVRFSKESFQNQIKTLVVERYRDINNQ